MVGKRNLGGLPNITGVVQQGGNLWFSASGAFALNETASQHTHAAGTAQNNKGFNFDASRSSAAYGRYGGKAVVPESINVLFCIKY